MTCAHEASARRAGARPSVASPRIQSEDGGSWGAVNWRREGRDAPFRHFINRGSASLGDAAVYIECSLSLLLYEVWVLESCWLQRRQSYFYPLGLPPHFRSSLRVSDGAPARGSSVRSGYWNWTARSFVAFVCFDVPWIAAARAVLAPSLPLYVWAAPVHADSSLQGEARPSRRVRLGGLPASMRLGDRCMGLQIHLNIARPLSRSMSTVNSCLFPPVPCYRSLLTSRFMLIHYYFLHPLTEDRKVLWNHEKRNALFWHEQCKHHKVFLLCSWMFYCNCDQMQPLMNLCWIIATELGCLRFPSLHEGIERRFFSSILCTWVFNLK